MWPIILGLGAAGFLLAGALASSSRPSRARQPSGHPKGPKRSRKEAWQTTEQRACHARGRKHLGGPGRADCSGGIEVKAWARPVDAGTVRREHSKGRTMIIAPGGFTEPARREAQRLGIKLSHR